MYKESFYDEVIRVLNLNTQSLTFKGGYHIAIYGQQFDIVEINTTNKFLSQRINVIPVSEEISQETASVIEADRSDYIFQYRFMFRIRDEAKVKIALQEFRDYWFANKQVVIEGYTTSVKTNRGDKQGTLPDNGDYWVTYTIKLFTTAVKNGYIWKDTDKWEMKLTTEGSYDQLSLVEETTSTQANTSIIQLSGKGVGDVLDTTTIPIFRVIFNDTDSDNNIYAHCIGQLDKDTKFNLRHTFNGSTYNYIVYLSGGKRTRQDNGLVIMEFQAIEAR